MGVEFVIAVGAAWIAGNLLLLPVVFFFACRPRAPRSFGPTVDEPRLNLLQDILADDSSID